jgi:hypothetical protein
MDDPMINDPKNSLFNLDRRCNALQDHAKLTASIQMAKSNVLVSMGDDFSCANQLWCF